MPSVKRSRSPFSTSSRHHGLWPADENGRPALPALAKKASSGAVSRGAGLVAVAAAGVDPFGRLSPLLFVPPPGAPAAPSKRAATPRKSRLLRPRPPGAPSVWSWLRPAGGVMPEGASDCSLTPLATLSGLAGGGASFIVLAAIR